MGDWTYEAKDFLTPAPYEALYQFHGQPFVHETKLQELSVYAANQGFRGFKSMYKKYIESLKAQAGTVYVDNVTNFTGQPLELNAGDWDATDLGVYRRNGFADELACPHPIMPVERLINIDTGEEKLGKYRGHFLHEILKIDPSYLSWIAYKFTPKIPKQERFVKIAQAYHSIHLDIMQRKSREKRSSSRYLGELGEKLTDLKLKVTRVRLEDDPYKTRVNGTTPQFFVKQILTLTDASGNLAVMSIPSKNPSAVSCTLSGIEHEYRLGEIIYIESAKVSRRYESYGSKYTRLSHVKFANLNV